ncbi:MAG: hypothetical protein COB30_007620 [Ectothiorhodospiraceae bacterium]|nr:hypothetical protein [Ectothiorhodospiraceae bacterium]
MQIYNVDLPQVIIEKIREQALVIALDKPSVAVQWYDMVFEKIFSLESMSERCPESSESQYFTYVVRRLLIGNYRLLFRMVGDTVRVLDFKGGGQSLVI